MGGLLGRGGQRVCCPPPLSQIIWGVAGLPTSFSYAYVKATGRVVLGWAYRGLTGGFLLLQNFCAAISVSPHVCFILVLILISMFLR